jgi:hypothetical protein
MSEVGFYYWINEGKGNFFWLVGWFGVFVIFETGSLQGSSGWPQNWRFECWDYRHVPFIMPGGICLLKERNKLT